MPKTELVRLRVSDREKLAFEEAASIAGLSLSAWARERLRWAATSELERADRPVAYLERTER